MGTTIRRIIQGGFASFFRNSFVSLASVLVMTITLMISGTLFFVDKILESALVLIQNKVDVNVYLENSATEEEALTLKERLEGRPGVAAVEYISREEALERYIERNKNDPINLEVLDELGENPLGAVLNVRATNPSEYESINAFLNTDAAAGEGGADIIREVNYTNNQVIIERLINLIDRTEFVSLVIAVAVSAIAILVTFNTFRLIIYMARDEVAVMKLVGASDDYIRGPFVVTGMITGLFAAILTMILFYPATYFVAPGIETYIESINIHDYYLANFGQLLVLLSVAGIILGAISSSLAVKRYLRV
jgi:cell division transport system permease protein